MVDGVAHWSEPETNNADVRLIDKPTQVAVSLATEENQTQQTRVVSNPLTHILTKRKLFWFIAIGLPLQDLNFVRKKLKVFM